MQPTFIVVKMSCEERQSFIRAQLRCFFSAAAVTLMMLLLTGDWVVSGQDATTAPGLHRRFEYKLSFKGPYLVQKDGTIPFWEHFGHAIASEDSIRITPSLKSKKGSVWSKEQNIHINWEIEVIFRINGRGRIGADGLAIWYTEEKGVEGPVFGSSDKWKGLGIFFDSFDNDGQRNNPYIMAMVNDGTLAYDHDADGSSQQLGGCLRDFRNKPFPVRVKIEYYKKALTIFFHSGVTNNPADYELCMRAEGVNINPNGYFGVSAATGGLADDQDVLAFLTHSLLPPAEMPLGKDRVPDEERKKFEREYDDYRDKLDKAREEYKKEHPSKPGDMIDDDKAYEAQDVKELRMIFDGQNEIHRLVRTLLVKLDEVIGRQERELSMLTLINNQGSNSGQQQQQQQGSQGQLPHTSTIQRHEVDSVLNSQKDISSGVRELRSVLNDVQSRVTDLRAGTSGGQVDTSEIVRQLQDVKSHFGGVQNDVKTLLSKPQGSSAACPASDSCVTPFLLFTFLLGQLACIIGYLMYRNSREAAAKKFY